MNERGKKLEPKFGLDMPFGEALARFARVKPAELNASIEASKSTAAPPVKGNPRNVRKRPKQ